MSVLYVALPIAIALGATALWACVRCIRAGQFDDLDTPPMRMLVDDHPLDDKSHGEPRRDDSLADQPPR